MDLVSKKRIYKYTYYFISSLPVSRGRLSLYLCRLLKLHVGVFVDRITSDKKIW